jgi:adenylate kinase
VLVTGTPGTGKTTLSRLLAKALDGEYVNLVMLLRPCTESCSLDTERKTRVVSITKLRKALVSAARHAESGLVIDSHIPFKLPSAIKLEGTIVLRCSPHVLERRLRRKRWPRSKIRENIQAEILDICLWDAVQTYGWKKVTQIDTTKILPRTTERTAIRSLKEDVRKRTRIDWLSASHRTPLAKYLT